MDDRRWTMDDNRIGLRSFVLGLPVLVTLHRPDGQMGGMPVKAIVWTRYGPPSVLRLKEVAKPIPKENEVLIRIHAATVMKGDCELRGLSFPISFQIPFRLFMGLTRPKRRTILGQEVAGDIEAVGKEVTRFKEGDQVFAPTFFRFSAYAEYICLPERYPVAKPTGLT
jgi:NADPH:quinone reductase-like Zn-dependent oxidoreductase